MTICSRNNCSGCWACRDICPKNCIDFDYDNLSVPYPIIDTSKCVNCGLCKRVCPNNTAPIFYEPKKVYAAWSKDSQTRKTSASGGIATELYRLFLNNKGVATGVMLDEQFEAKYIILEKLDDVPFVQNSKYVYSNTNGIFKTVKGYLDANISVLFIGLPCHVAALLNYLKKTYDNLITVDIICHGVAPSEYLNQHIANIKQKYRKDISKCLFRDPAYKTHKFIFSLYNKDKCVYHKRVDSNDIYQLGYHKALIYRESCYHCKYARKERCSDLTIGDFSGLGRLEECDFNSINVSCLMVNTSKGERVVDLLFSTVSMFSRPIEEATNFERQLKEPSKKHPNRKQFEEIYIETNNFVAAATPALKSDIRNSNLPPNLIQNILKSFISVLLPKKVKTIIKKLIKNVK